MKGRILVIRGGAIGDFVLTLPVLAALRQRFPETALDVMGYPHIASLARLAGTVTEVRPIESRSLAGFFARGGALDPALADYFASCDVIFSYLFDPDSIFHTNVARVSRAQLILGPHRPDESSDLHATDQLLKPLERLAIFDAVPMPTLPSNPAKVSLRPPALAVHPGSGSERKNWPETHWIELLRIVAKSTPWHVRLVGGEAEEMRLERLAEHLPVDRVEIWRSLPLHELASRLATCSRFIGHDSGISHMAAAAGVPVLALWGPTREAVWRPRGRSVDLIHAPEGLPRLEPVTVAAKLLGPPPS